MLIKDSFGDFSFVIPVDVHGQKGFKMFPFNAENAAAHAEINKPILRNESSDDKFQEIIKEIVDVTQNILDKDNLVYVDFKKKKKVN